MVVAVEVINVNQNEKSVTILEWMEGWIKRLVGN